MPAAKRFIAAALALGIGVALTAAVLRPTPPQTILLSHATVAPLRGEDALAVFLTIENSGGPDRLISAEVPGAEPLRIEAPNVIGGLPFPAGSRPSLAADGAWLRLDGIDTPREGQLLPVTLTFAEAGTVSTKARFADPTERGEAAAFGLFGIGDICIVEEGEPAPQLTLDVRPLGDGWEVVLLTDGFVFHASEAAIHVPGEGHGHLYVGGVKLQRLYEDRAIIGALPPGDHQITVTLNTNDHRAYVVDNVPVTASVTVRQM